MNTITKEESDKILKKYYDIGIKDNTIKQRQYNIERLTSFNKVIHKNKKNRHKIYKYKQKNSVPQTNFKVDPYKFKVIPSDIKETILNLTRNSNTCLTYVAFKCNIPYHIIHEYIYNNKIIDNYDLKKILDFFNYNLF